MKKFVNSSRVPQGFYLPSMIHSWESNTTLKPGEVIETANENDIAYLRKLVSAGVLSELE
jgi:hypothetical protein